MQYSISEILEKADRVEGPGSKVAILQQYQNPQLRNLLYAAFDPRVEWLLPKGPMPFRPNLPEGSEGVLYAQLRTFYLYLKDAGAPPGLQQDKREQLFTMLLESVDPQDAILLLHVKDKKLPYHSITPSIVATAFPGLLQGVPADPNADGVTLEVIPSEAIALREAGVYLPPAAEKAAGIAHIKPKPKKKPRKKAKKKPTPKPIPEETINEQGCERTAGCDEVSVQPADGPPEAGGGGDQASDEHGARPPVEIQD